MVSQRFLAIAIIALGGVLSGCSTPTTTKAAKELCSGTKRPYEIKGITYTPQDHYDYDEVGVASWYGPGFHGKPGACGSTYDQHAYTAAHKTLPIPSVVEVTNLENGKNVRLVVNDRGPFVDDRIIDLSKRASQDLGSHGKGLAKVRVKVIPEESHALAQHLKQYGRYGLHPEGRSWDVIYREHIAGKHHHIPKNNHAVEAVHHSDADNQPIFQDTGFHKNNPHPTLRELSYTPTDREKFESLLEDMDRASPPQKNLKKKPSSPEAERPAQKAPMRQDTPRFIQVGSFVQKTKAQALVNKISRHGKARVAKDQANLYTIKLGPYTSPQQAKKTMASLINDGHHGVRLIAN